MSIGLISTIIYSIIAIIVFICLALFSDEDGIDILCISIFWIFVLCIYIVGYIIFFIDMLLQYFVTLIRKLRK